MPEAIEIIIKLKPEELDSLLWHLEKTRTNISRFTEEDFQDWDLLGRIIAIIEKGKKDALFNPEQD